MYSLNINLGFDENYEQLDTIEERSQECTPVYDINRQLSKDWGKLQTLSALNKSSLKSISEVEDEEIQKIQVVRSASKKKASKIALKQILGLKNKLRQLEEKIVINKQEISVTESENFEMQVRIKDLEDGIKVKVTSDSCLKLCSVF